MTNPETAKLSADTAASTPDPSLAERISTLETAVSSLAASLATIQNRVSELLHAKKDN